MERGVFAFRDPTIEHIELSIEMPEFLLKCCLQVSGTRNLAHLVLEVIDQQIPFRAPFYNLFTVPKAQDTESYRNQVPTT